MGQVFSRKVLNTVLVLFSQKIIVFVRRLMFEVFSKGLTGWATTFMLDKYSKLHLMYDIGKDFRGGTFCRTVTNINTGDKFFVTSEFRCTLDPDSPIYGGKKCWNQVYSGVLCIHGLVACVDRIKRAKEQYEKERICYEAMSACHAHWYRSQYGAAQTNEVHLVDPASLSRSVVAGRRQAAAAFAEEKEQFNNLLSICSRASVLKCLQDLHVAAMNPILLTELTTSSQQCLAMDFTQAPQLALVPAPNNGTP